MASRKDNTFALHYSIDGEKYYLVRIFNLAVEKTLKVGLSAQSPAGVHSIRIFKDLTITDYKLSNIRSGEF